MAAKYIPNVPTPVGHALGALILTAPVRARWRLLGAGATAVAIGAGVAPDLDLLVSRHSAETHSVGAAAIGAAIAWLLVRRRRPSAAVALSIVVALGVLSHVLLDWLGTDTSAPIGIMALWPFSSGYYEADAHVFMAVSRRYWLPEFWTYNLTVLLRELVLLGLPALGVELFLRRRHAARIHPADPRRSAER